MSMRMGEALSVTLFGESHGAAVGALLEGLPAGTPIDMEGLAQDMAARSPGGPLASKRQETDVCELISGVYEGHATGWPILILIRNRDARSSDYDFLPEHPRPGHADLPELTRSEGSSDPRGGGSHSGRLTAGLVAAASICRPLAATHGVDGIEAHTSTVGDIEAQGIENCPAGAGDDHARIRCRDADAARNMVKFVEQVRKQRDSVGSSVELRISGLPLGFGEPWFAGLEPALAHALMAIPGARAVEFGRGVHASRMRGSEHNDPWEATESGPRPAGERADGALGGLATGADLFVRLHLKPPSSIPQEQLTLHLETDEPKPLVVGGRHDPVLAPRVVPVVEAAARLVLCDLALRGGWSR